MKRLNNKNVLLGVSGGIAAYKSAELARRLRDAGATVIVVLTEAAKEFITPLTMQAVSGNPVRDSLFDPNAEAAMGHIELARWADLIMIVPATADCIAKLAHGQANDLLSAICLATQTPIALAPAMNQQMWQDAATQENISLLKKRGFHVWGPATGDQACGEFGPGRLLEPQALIESAEKLFKSGALEGVHVLITVGPTREYIDPIRFLSNPSSGKMGYAMAEAAIEAGASVTIVSGPVSSLPPEHARVIHVISAQEMHDHVMKEVKGCQLFMGVAAVTDFRAEEIAKEKISKNDVTELNLKMVQNPDILAEVAQLKSAPFTVGFAAHTNAYEKDGKEKLMKKKLDMVVVNPINADNPGFESDENEVTILWRDGEKKLPKARKLSLAREVIQVIAERYREKNST